MKNLNGICKMETFDIGNDQIQGDRDYQQDKFTTVELENGACLAILADGMGGYKGGEIASKIVTDTFRKEFTLIGNIEESLKKTLLKANYNIKLKKNENSELNQMGTTIIVLYFTENHFQWISVGDSPLYLLIDNKISRKNKNHSIAGLLELQYKKGDISETELKNNPNRHMLTSAITGEEIPQIDISKLYKFTDNIKIILASDGIETLSQERILQIANENKDNQDTCEKIIRLVDEEKRKNQDNATLIIISKRSKILKDDENTPTLKLEPISKTPKRKSNKLIFYFLFLIFLLSLTIIYFKYNLGTVNRSTKMEIKDNKEVNQSKIILLKGKESNFTKKNNNLIEENNLTKDNNLTI